MLRMQAIAVTMTAGYAVSNSAILGYLFKKSIFKKYFYTEQYMHSCINFKFLEGKGKTVLSWERQELRPRGWGWFPKGRSAAC